MSVLRRGKIWALNIGESWHVTRQGWEEFAHGTVAALLFFKPMHLMLILFFCLIRFFCLSPDLPSTNITHMYASEGTNLTATLKKQMMTAARRNRRYDKRHYNKVSAVVIVVVDVVVVAGDRGAVAVAFYFVGAHSVSSCFLLFHVNVVAPATAATARATGTSLTKSPTCGSTPMPAPSTKTNSMLRNANSKRAWSLTEKVMACCWWCYCYCCSWHCCCC